MRGDRQASGPRAGRLPARSIRPAATLPSPALQRSVPQPAPAQLRSAPPLDPGLILPWLFLLVACLSAATTARATLLEPLTLHDLTGRADVVLHGRVESVHTTLHGPGRMPVTMARIAVLEVIAGDLPPRRQIVVTQPGGTAGGVALEYAGRPRFNPGREVVLFLARRTEGQFITVGLAQGKYNVAADDGHGRRRLSRDLHGAAFAIPASETPPEDLSDLRTRVLDLPRDLTGARP